MISSTPTPDSSEHVLHIVGHVTEAVFSFMGPTTDALARAGYRQTVVMLDMPRHSHLRAKFHESIRVEPIPAGRNLQHWVQMERAIRVLMAQKSYSAVHLHGFLPWALGTRMGRLIPKQVPLYYSPHGSRTLTLLKPLRAVLGSLMSTVSSGQPQVIASTALDARRVARLSAASVKTVEAAVDDDFFLVERHEARRPLVVSGDQDDNHRSVALFCRQAVQLSSAELGLSFNWIGHIDPLVAARLKAANVGSISLADRKEMISRLTSGWIFLAAGTADEFPVMLSWAMALGMPCVAADTPHHRDLVQDGVTGLLYKSEEDALVKVSQLIDSKDLRDRIGAAAKQQALERHSKTKLYQGILGAYAKGQLAHQAPLRTGSAEGHVA